MSNRKQCGYMWAAITAEVIWLITLVLDVFVFARLTQWVWEHTVSGWLQVPHLSFVEAFLITLISSVMSFLIVERVRKDYD